MKGYNHQYYKPTIWDKIIIEGCGFGFLILFLAGIWINDFRWKLIITSLFLLGIGIIQVSVLEDRDDKEKNKLMEKELEKTMRNIKGGSKK